MSEAAAGKGHSGINKIMKGSAPEQNDVRVWSENIFLTSKRML